jgi:tetratricopeptide (TPR) repeat protein
VPRQRTILLAGGAIALAALAVYHNSFSAPFVFDAAPIVTRYPTIRHLWPIWDALRPPHDGSTVDGRPLVNFVLAISYALSGTRVWAYHAVDVAIHIFAGMTLFGVIRRTLRWSALTPMRVSASGAAQRIEVNALHPPTIAFVAALLWTVHPLQTESITYVIQCAESLMGLFYLLTLYCFIRYACAPSSSAEASADKEAGSCIWAVLSILACLLGMATKEVMVSAPVMVLLYDRTFVAGSFRAAWERRWQLYAALAATWILLVCLVIGSGSRTGSAGFSANVRWVDYALTQVYAVVHYARLALWPRPLVFDYGTALVTDAARILPSTLVLVALLIGTIWALWRRPALGFLGAWFFAILAPTSLVPVATQPIAEHRMYLPLAAIMVGIAVALFSLVAAVAPGRKNAGGMALAASLALAAGYGAVTLNRNARYATETGLWADTVAKVPQNPRAHLHLGHALYDLNRIAEADAQFRLALVLQPYGNFDAQFDLGNAELREGRVPEAMDNLAEAVRLKPDSFAGQSSWGDALFAAGRIGEAMEHYEQALRLNPDYALAHYNLGNVQAQLGRMPEAIEQYQAALRLNPAYAEAEDNLGNALFQERRFDAALVHYEAAARLTPDNARVQYNLGNALLQVGRVDEAKEHYEAALRLKPDFAEVQDMLHRLSLAGHP